MRLLLTSAVLLWAVCIPIAAQAPPPLSPDEQALMEAAYTGNLEEVRRLVAKGTSVNAADADKRVAHMWAAFNGHTPVVGYLLANGAKVDAKDVNGRTALMYASSGPFHETVELLVEKGAKVNVQGKAEGFTALMTAAAEGHLEVVRVLLAHGADPTLEDVDGDTAESFARQKGFTEVAELLRDPPAAAAAD